MRKIENYRIYIVTLRDNNYARRDNYYDARRDNNCDSKR